MFALLWKGIQKLWMGLLWGSEWNLLLWMDFGLWMVKGLGMQWLQVMSW